jgi:hypothetical protein
MRKRDVGLPGQSTQVLGGFMALAIILLIAFGILLLLREVWCWYWKINLALEKLESIDQSLKEIAERQTAVAAYDPQTPGQGS